MVAITTYINDKEARKLTGKYVILILGAIIIGAFSVFIFLLKGAFKNAGFSDIIFLIPLVVTLFLIYFLIKMIRNIRGYAESGAPIILLTDKQIEIAGKMFLISEIKRFETTDDTTIAWMQDPKKFFQIMPYMRGDVGKKVDKELMRLWKEQGGGEEE